MLKYICTSILQGLLHYYLKIKFNLIELFMLFQDAAFLEITINRVSTY